MAFARPKMVARLSPVGGVDVVLVGPAEVVGELVVVEVA